jgi:hypothetical protein
MGECENWTFTLPSELPLWELESRWIFEFLENDCRGVKTHWIEEFLIPLEISWNLDVWNGLAWPIWTSETQIMAKRKAESQIWQFDSRPIKCWNRLNFLMWRWCATYRWKALDKVYKFSSHLISIGGFHTKLWPCKFAEVPTLGILRLPLGSPGTNWHLGASLVARHKVYYKREGGSYPQVRTMVSLMNPCLPVACPSTKSIQITH